MKKIKLVVLLFIGLIQTSYAQNILTLEQIIAEALLSNFDLAIAANNAAVATNRATKAQSGYLPAVNLNAGTNYSNNNTKLTFAGGFPDSEIKGAQSTSYTTGIGFNYLVFNGFGRVHTYQNLMSSKQLTALQSQVVAENLVLDLVTRYLDIQQNKLNLQATNDNLAVSADRLKRVQLANQFGNKSQLDVLSAEVDYNNDSLAIATIETAIAKQKSALNTLMGKNPSEEFTIPSEVSVPLQQPMEEIAKLALQNNASILLAQVSQQLTANQLSITEGQRLPQLTANGNYGYSNAQNGAGIVLSQSTLGFSGGLTLSMPIFNGNQLTTAIKNAALSNQNQELELKKARLSIQNQLRNAELDEALLKLTLAAQEANIGLAEAALKRAQLSYNAGNITFNDLRIAQLNLLVAKNNHNQAKINLVKLYYTTAQLSGGLLGL
jgi:outer membrane protein TolC